MYNIELDTFVMVAECGSFSKAAKRLYISTAAVAQQMNILEQKLGAQLFTRNKRGVTLTEAGQALLPRVIQIRQLCQDAQRVVSHYKNTLTIGIGYLSSCNMINKWLTPFKKKYPEFNIDFAEIQDYNNIPDNVDLLEMAYSIEPVVKQGFDFLKCTSSEMIIALSPDDPLAKNETLTLQNLAGRTIELNDPEISGNPSEITNELSSVRPRIKLQYYRIFNRALIRQAQLDGNLLLVPSCYQGLASPYVLRKVAWKNEPLLPYGFFYRRQPAAPCQKFLDFVQNK